MEDKTTLERALLAIRKLKDTIQNLEQKIFEPIAIVGLACRFPGANNKNEFWELLAQGKNVITKLPIERWELLAGTEQIALRNNSHPYWGSYLPDIPGFDAYFFGISPREALRMDPQQRLLLEVAYETFEDAGLPLSRITNSNCGVFLGMYASQIAQLQEIEDDMDALFLPSGNASSIAANRISYQFDLHGPSMVIDTACSSSLTALHEACLSLQTKQCDMALVGGAHINLLPYINLVLAKAKMLSPTGQCHTFDAAADGYVPGEGVGFVLVKPLSAAIRDNDKIYATVLGSAVNQDGKTNGLTAPNGALQEEVLRTAYQTAKIEPKEIGYIECHGTGTFLGDPIEAQALGEIVGKNRGSDQHCYIGSVKTNIGHLEPAAGIASIIKTALSLQKKQLPPHLNFKTPNPHIDFANYHLQVVNQLREFPQYGNQRLAAISGFGFGGTNAHVVLGEYSNLLPIKQASSNAYEIFIISAKDMAALKQTISAWCDYLARNKELPLAQICYNTQLRRTHHTVKLAIIASNSTELYDRLRNLNDDIYLKSPYIFIDLDQSKKHDLNLISDTIAPNLQELFHNYKTNNIVNTKAEFLTDLISKNEYLTKIFKAFTNNGLAVAAIINLQILAAFYVSNVKINWEEFNAERQFSLLEMPTYPWQHKTYWPPLKKLQKKSLLIDDYPLHAAYLTSPLVEKQFEFNFDLKTLPEIRDTFNVLHVGYYLEMLAFAMSDLGDTNFAVQDLDYLSPMIVTEDAALKVQLILTEEAAGYRFSFYSNPGLANWTQNAIGKLTPKTTLNKIESIDEIKKRCSATNNAEYFYKRITDMNMPAGESIRWTEQFWQNTGVEVLAKFIPPNLAHVGQVFKLNQHPGIGDACVQVAFLGLPTEYTKPYVASHFDKIIINSLNHDDCYLYAKITRIIDSSAKVVSDWYLISAAGEVYAAGLGMVLTQYEAKFNVSELAKSSSEEKIELSQDPVLAKRQIFEYLLKQASLIFSMPESDIDINKSLSELGMDSLMGLVLIRLIQSAFDYNYALQELSNLSLNSLCEKIIALKMPVLQNGVKELAEVPRFTRDDNATKTISQNNEFLSMPKNIDLDNPWISHRQKNAAAKIRLFCFPFGGGGASVYHDWHKYLSPHIEVCPIQLPGREERMNETPVSDINTLIHLLIENLQTEINIPYAMFGHSFGALLAFEFARYCMQYHLPQPIHLFPSAYPDPATPTKSLDNLLQELSRSQIDLFRLNQSEIFDALSDEQLKCLVAAFNQNGLFDYADPRVSRQILKIILPTFIADMSVVKSYKYSANQPFDFPITVFLGKQDTWILPADHYGWQKYSKLKTNFIEFDSTHLFMKEEACKKEICKIIDESIGSNICAFESN